KRKVVKDLRRFAFDCAVFYRHVLKVDDCVSLQFPLQRLLVCRAFTFKIRCKYADSLRHIHRKLLFFLKERLFREKSCIDHTLGCDRHLWRKDIASLQFCCTPHSFFCGQHPLYASVFQEHDVLTVFYYVVREIGRASCRERVSMAMGEVRLQKEIEKLNERVTRDMKLSG